MLKKHDFVTLNMVCLDTVTPFQNCTPEVPVVPPCFQDGLGASAMQARRMINHITEELWLTLQ